VVSETEELEPIADFRGRHHFLTNFHMHAIWPSWWPRTLPPIPSNEHGYAMWKINPDVGIAQWLKLAEEIRTAKSCMEAKKLGQKVPLREHWDADRLAAMRHLIDIKFRDPALGTMLVNTHPRPLIEGNNHGDDFWGCIQKDGEWKGDNWLGRLLTEKRAALIAFKQLEQRTASA